MSRIIQIQLITILIIFTLIFLSSCNNKKITSVVKEFLPEKVEHISLEKIKDTKINLISGEKASNILSKNDYYIKNLSTFDFAAKFKSEKPLSYDEIKTAYKNVVLDWNKDQKIRIEYIIIDLEKYFKNKNFNIPKEINIIKTNGQIEAGAAYTRANAIVFSNHLVESKSDKELKQIFIHELFHIYTNNNLDKKDDLYKIIGFNRCKELKLPENLSSRLISNPDAPENNFYIECKYKNKDFAFMPILYSKSPYNIDSALTFFNYLNDDMIAVTINENKTPKIIYENNKPLIVKKNSLENFYDIIGHNTEYTYHPEEILAENFVLMVMDEEIMDKHITTKLKEIVFE